MVDLLWLHFVEIISYGGKINFLLWSVKGLEAHMRGDHRNNAQYYFVLVSSMAAWLVGHLSPVSISQPLWIYYTYYFCVHIWLKRFLGAFFAVGSSD